MSILTKFLVVLVTVLSIVLVALVVPLVATQDNKTQQLDEEINRRQAAERSAEITEAELTQALQQASAADRLNKQTIADLTEARDREAAAKVEAQAEARAARSQLVELKASYQTLASTMQEQARINELISNQLAESQATVQEQGARLLQLADANDALTSERDTLVRRVRQFQEQGTVLREQLKEAKEQLAQIPAEVREKHLETREVSATIRPDEPIAGKVTAVEDLGDGVMLVQVNVGESDNVVAGMEFLVHEGDTFKGTLVIDRVESRRSVGRMQLVKGDIQKGDAIYTGPY